MWFKVKIGPKTNAHFFKKIELTDTNKCAMESDLYTSKSWGFATVAKDCIVCLSAYNDPTLASKVNLNQNVTCHFLVQVIMWIPQWKNMR